MDLTSNRVTADTLKWIRQENRQRSCPSSSTNSGNEWPGWPSERKEAPGELRVYWNYRDELSVYDVLYKSHQVIVPASLRPEMLRKIHKAHQGADSSIRWSQECRQLSERHVYRVEFCSQFLSERPQEPMKSHEIPNRPWSKVTADIFQLAGSNYLVMVDQYNHFFELDSLRNITASTVIRAMKRSFARYGIPDECITDNDPQFGSHDFLAAIVLLENTDLLWLSRHLTTAGQTEKLNPRWRLQRIF